MTKKAIQLFIGNAVLSDLFREQLTSRRMTHQDIAAVDRNLDEQDVNAIVLALMNTGDFPHFAAAIAEYNNLRLFLRI